MPLPAALRLMEDSQALAAEEQRQRQKAENAVRDLALEVARLSAELQEAQLAAGTNGFFPSNGEVRPTGLTVTKPSAGGTIGTRTHSTAVDGPDISVMPPPEGDE
jgi:hypothetical protein